MKQSLQAQGAAYSQISNREMVAGLQDALEKNYRRVLQSASDEWENRFAGNDPSDACVTVRITQWGPAIAAFSTPGRPALRSFASQAA